MRTILQMTIPKNTATFLFCIALGGCAIQKQEPQVNSTVDPVSRSIDASAQRIEALMVELKGMKLPDKPIAEGDLVNINWVGEATMLVASLAKARGFEFEKRGAPELPLPITIVENKATFDEVLEKIAAQIDSRANLLVTDKKLVIEYRLKGVVQ